MNILDIRTVLISYFISNAICAFVMLYLWRNNRKRSPEIGYWLADFILQFLAIFLILLRSNIPPFVSIILANAFVIGGTILLFIGLEKYMGMVSPRYPNYILLGVFLLIHIYFTYANESLQARNINASVALLLLCAQCAWLLLRRVGKESKQATRLPGIIFAIYSAVIVTRIILDSTIPQSNDLFKSGLYDTLVLLTYQMLFIALTFSLFLMVNRKLFGELENDIILRKTAQEKLTASEEKFSLAFQNSPDAIILSAIDTGKIIEANERFFQLSQFTREETIAKSTIELKFWENAFDRVKYVENLKKNFRVSNFETIFRKKSGELFPCWISSEMLNISNERYVISVIHDLTEKKKAEEQIKTLTRFPEENPNPVLRIDSTGKILYANPASREIIDYWQSLYSDGVPVFWGNSINEASTMHHPVEIVEDFNGKTISFILSASPNAGVINVYGRDVTEKIKASKELEIERNKLKSILEKINDGVYIVNQEYDIEYVNPVLIKEFGHPGDKKCYEYFNDLENPCEWCKNRDVFKGNSIQWEWYSPKDGKTFSIFETPVINSDGTISKMEVFHDISALKKTEQELRSSEESFRLIFERSTIGKSLTAPDGKLIKVNNAFPAMLGYTIKEFQDINFAEITFPEDIPASREVIRSILANEKDIVRFEKRYLHKDGSTIWGDVSTNLLRDAKGEPVYFITSVIDITERKKLEVSLKKNEADLRAIIDSTPFPVALVDSLDEKIEMWSHSAITLFGHTAPTTTEWYRIAYPDPKYRKEVINCWKPMLIKAHSSGHVVNTGEYRVTCSDGSERICELYAAFVGEKLIVTFNDITEDKLAAAKLCQAKDYTDRLIETANVMIVALDADGDILVFNHAAEELTGYTKDELVGRNWFEVITPKDRYPEVWDEFNRLASNGLPQTFENPILTKDGRERIVSWKNRDLRDAGMFAGTISFGIDITDSKRAQIELLQSEIKYRTLHESMMDAFVMTDMQGHLIEFNRSYQEMLGYSLEELYQSTYVDLTPEKWHAMEAEIVEEQVLIRGFSDVYEKEYITKDRRIIPIEIRTYLLKDEKEKATAMWSIIRNISDRKKAEEVIMELNEGLEEKVEERTMQLIAANKELETFSYSVSHDLRAPLRALDGFSLAILEDYNDKLDNSGKKYLNRIREASQKMATLIDSMLILSRVSKTDLNLTKVNMTKITKDISSNLRKSNPKRKVTWKIEPGMTVPADSALIKSALENLIGNAWKFTAKHASANIEVGSIHENGRMIYFVRDDGAGFDMQYASKLFGAFQRMHSSADFEGTGVGLATVQRIINKHGGRIWAEGKPEEGATFYFTLSNPQERK
jgi:PAS domain S-box-containing protein